MPTASDNNRVLRSRRVSYALPAAVAVSLLSASCSTTPATPQDPTHAAVCVDTKSQTRVADTRCSPETANYRRYWYPHTSDLVYPAVGAAIALGVGSFVRPNGARLKESGVPAAGGKIVRGGFGKSSNDGSSSGS
ncbi:hypothetical protein ACFVMC_12235 [Nocardia sp. NPDC127579]|uniref:hypothetical protein n=1 Tax=Nocardia sp. NPDC127579 TaxID=3345402 RepID=UPI00362CDD4E